jgi:hypothetical protein
MSTFVTVRTFDNYVSAHIVKGKLETDGITCVLKDENVVTMQWHLGIALGGIKLQVLEAEVEDANFILETLEEEARLEQDNVIEADEEDEEQLNPDNKVCTHCGSKNTRKDDYSKTPAMLSWLLLGFPLFFKSDKWHCFHCGAKF